MTRETSDMAITTTPRTLLSLAGATPMPLPLTRAAILVIDAQQEYVDGHMPLTGIDAALAEIAALLDRARTLARPIFHVAHIGRAATGGPFDPERPGVAFANAAKPRDGEPVITKRLPNAFAGTDLTVRVEAAAVDGLIVCGFMTHMCVSSTVRSALDHGIATTVVAEAAATRDLPGHDGGVVEAATVHRAALAALADRFAPIVATAADLREG